MGAAQNVMLAARSNPFRTVACKPLKRLNRGYQSVRFVSWEAVKRGVWGPEPKKKGALSQMWEGGYLDPDLSLDDIKRNSKAGDAWPVELLKLKSCDDLHKLWFVLLKEKNFLEGEKWDAYEFSTDWEDGNRLEKVELSMENIREVIHRREVHEHCLRAIRILQHQKRRERLETSRYHLEEKIKGLIYKVEQ
eukprot:GHVN01057644.1.p1 GENE.GHVN01057644.1~~GHVN01057644.1.p1  ORF type:complete len:192 (+),score=21.83 GHVN01057644.1:1204-1779(+)